MADHADAPVFASTALLVLGGEAHGRVERAVAVVAVTSLDDLEEDRPDRGRVEVQELARLVAVVHDVQVLELVEQRGIDVVPRLDVVVVVGRDVEGTEAAIARRSRECEHIGCRERDVLGKDRILVGGRAAPG